MAAVEAEISNGQICHVLKLEMAQSADGSNADEKSILGDPSG